MAGGAHIFGGWWTDQKLAILRQYLTAYTTALSKRQFKKTYIDAFAGTGRRESSAEAKRRGIDRQIVQGEIPEISDWEGEDEPVQGFLDGSARVALQCEPAFDSYVFIEKSPTRHQQLEGLRAEFPHLAERMSIKKGDANTEIQAMCVGPWRNQRAVLFLDPYGTQVRWTTIEAIAKTHAIDLWVLFPLGAVHRMLTQSGDIPQKWRACLDELLGTSDWYDRFYQIEASENLFHEKTERFVKAQTEVIGEYFLERLRQRFAGVALNPAILRNSKNSPLYLFCFAVGNPRGAPIALRIAEHILKMGS
jgi:three-Cys-motif partner protein